VNAPSVRQQSARRADSLAVLCERRIGRRVLAAAPVRVKTPSGARVHALALADNALWWIELSRFRGHLGAVLAWRLLEDLVVYSSVRRLGGHRLELSCPGSGELLVGTVHGPGADRLVGQLTAHQFAQVATRSPALDEP
jgi:hypothetical protein